MKAILWLILQLLPVGVVFAFPGAGPGSAGRTSKNHYHEVRAVWITTVGGLDWPKSIDTAEQKASLLGILDTLATGRFNTVYFQVRGRGDAVYPSSLEPWAASLTGLPGGDPGWDPLSFVLSEAHRRGLEVHAWFNTYFVKGTGSVPPATDPPHVVNAHPEWVRNHDGQWWIDPGNHEARKYLVGLVADLIGRYDLDGVQMDYIRYPGRDFPDEDTYRRWGGGQERDEWRRANVTSLVREVGEMIAKVKPWIKLGCTPIGIYRNPDGIRGLESFADVYQDSYRWVREGLVDYIVPQLYWGLGGGNGDPDFAHLAGEWREYTRGRHLYLGIGSYKPEVIRQTRSLIDVTRATGADGIAFFRYSSISGLLPESLFASPAIPPSMSWKDSAIPPSPVGLSVSNAGGDVRELSWSPPAGLPAEGAPRFACLYRVRGGIVSPASLEELVGVFPLADGAVRDTIPDYYGDEVTYAVTTLDRAGRESPPAGVGRRTIAAETERSFAEGTVPVMGMPFTPESKGILFIPYLIGAPAAVSIAILDTARSELLRAWEGEQHAGYHVVSLDISSLGPGSYRCLLRAEGNETERGFLLRE